MENESAVISNRGTNENENSCSNSFSSETKGLTKKRTDKAQRSSTPSFISEKNPKANKHFLSLTAEGSIENLSNSYRDADEHERQERTRKRRSMNSRARSDSPEATSMTSNNVCVENIIYKEQTFRQAKCCVPPKSIKKKLEEYANRIVKHNICFSEAIMNCKLFPVYSCLSNSRHLYLKNLTESCLYEYDLMYNLGINAHGIRLYLYIDATFFCKHNWKTKEKMPDSNSFKKFILDPYIAHVNCLCQIEDTALEDEKKKKLITYLLNLDNVLRRYHNTISHISCNSYKLEDRQFSAQCMIDNTKDYTKYFVTLSNVTRLIEHISNADTTSMYSHFNNTFCFMNPQELCTELSTKTVYQPNTKEQSTNNPSKVSTSVSNSNPVVLQKLHQL